MTPQERKVLFVLALLLLGGLAARAWWRMRPPAPLPPIPANSQPATP